MNKCLVKNRSDFVLVDSFLILNFILQQKIVIFDKLNFPENFQVVYDPVKMLEPIEIFHSFERLKKKKRKQ